MSNTDTSAVARATRVVRLISAILWAVMLGLNVRARIRQECEEASPSRRATSTSQQAMDGLAGEVAKAARAAKVAQRPSGMLLREALDEAVKNLREGMEQAARQARAAQQQAAERAAAKQES